MGVSYRAVLVALVAKAALSQTGVEDCLAAVGPATADSIEWTARVTLTVSLQRDAARIVLDQQGAQHVGHIIFNVLGPMRFRQACVGKTLTFEIAWRESPDRNYGILVGRGLISVRGPISRPRARPRAPAGPHVLDEHDVRRLRTIGSLSEFLAARGVAADYR